MGGTHRGDSWAAGAQILVTTSYRCADAWLLASYDYLAMVWALLASLLIFGQWPSWAVLAGAAAIGGSGLLALFWASESDKALRSLNKSFDIPNEFDSTAKRSATKRGRLAGGMGIEGRDKQKALEAGATALSGQLGKRRPAPAQGL